MTTQSEIKYNRLMEKAEELFTKIGYKAVSMDEIAEAAGISKMTIYKHFSSKEELFIKVILSILDRNTVMLEEDMKKIPGTLKKIDHLMKYNVEMSRQYSLAFYKDIMGSPPIMEKVMKEKYRVSRVFFQKIITDGVRKGEIREVNVDFMTDMLIMLIGVFGDKYFDKITSKEEIEAATRDFYDFLKYGLLGEKEVE
ncbi:transcriptional regulator, TetR family [Natronincola peptidivorans]|uniref:Transcriptional regulator, TetR family n=1 Tax=Natronincola peptidivorans TaxID=426128 RepID=A0A1H9ZP05_9FIRM|nr:TetR/AcrR family transcriptional regulator [Natronincola peptidivorans]SES83075.1 transcriptional regulator, TetR family [Natronincola peptidivorans]